MEEFLIFWISGFFACNILGFLFARFMMEDATVRQFIVVFWVSLIPMLNIVATFFLVVFTLTIWASIFWDSFERKFKKTLDRPLSAFFNRNSK